MLETRMRTWLFGMLAILVVVSLVVTACGKKEQPPRSTPTPTQTAVGGWYWKSGGFIDYAPSGMPDFDQKQDMWSATAAAPTWSHCGPVAVANSLWWFDSEYEPSPKAPPIVNDNYPLVQSYSPVGAAHWDDHDSQNVQPLVEDLAERMDTDGQSSGDGHTGTNVDDMKDAIEQYLVDKGLDNDFYVHLQPSPDFEWIEAEIERCQDVVLLLGFWQWHAPPVTHVAEGYWVRIGGHYVTCAGVNSEESKLGISDPYWDNAEAGGAGRVPAAHTYPHNSSVHNDAKYVSHDIYDVVASTSPGGPWALGNYTEGKDVTNFQGQNWADDLMNYEGTYDADLSVHVEIDYAVVVSPYELSTRTPTRTAKPTVPQPTSTRTEPPTGGPIATATRTTPPVTPPPTATHKQVVTYVEGGYDVVDGVLYVSLHLQDNGGWKGKVFDIHIIVDGVVVYEEEFPEPLIVCEWYEWPVQVGPMEPKEVWVHLTGAPPGHANLGEVTIQPWQ